MLRVTVRIDEEDNALRLCIADLMDARKPENIEGKYPKGVIMQAGNALTRFLQEKIAQMKKSADDVKGFQEFSLLYSKEIKALEVANKLIAGPQILKEIETCPE